MKRLISLFLVIIMCLPLTVVASATEDDILLPPEEEEFTLACYLGDVDVDH